MALENAHVGSVFASAVEALFKRKYQVLLIISLTVGATVVLVDPRPAEYEAKASLLVKFGREYLYVPEVGNERARAPMRLQELINAEMQILYSRDLRETVIHDIGMETLYPEFVNSEHELSKAVERFGKKLTIKTIPDAHVVHVLFRHEQDSIATKVVNKLVEFFLIKRQKIYGKVDSSVFDKGLREVERELDAAEQRLDRYKRENGLFDFAEQTRIALRTNEVLGEKLRTKKVQLLGLEKKSEVLEQAQRSVPQSVTAHTEVKRNKVLDQANEQLLELRLQEGALLAKYHEESRTVTQIRQEIAQVKAFIAQEDEIRKESVRTHRNSLYDKLNENLVDARAELALLRAEVTGLQAISQEAREKLSMLSGHERQLEELDREVALLEKGYQEHMAKYREAKLSETLDKERQANISIIQEANSATQLRGVSSALRLALSVVVGILLAAGYVFVAERIRPTFGSEESVERGLGLPVLATLPLKKGVPS